MNLLSVSGRLGLILTVSLAPLLVGSSAGADDLNKAIELLIQANKKAASSQKRIDKMSDDSTDLLTQFRTIQEQIASVRAYNAQVETLLASQQQEIDALEEQIERATSVGREVTPLMIRMIDALENFIQLDVPFLPEERQRRIAKLREMLNRADVADSEKFRRILEAYQVEVAFGHDIEAYSANLIRNEGDQEIKVNFLRFGRVSLTYLTLDEQEAGAWDIKQRKWVVLPTDYRSHIKNGLRIAKKQTAPDLIRLPIFAPEESK